MRRAYFRLMGGRTTGGLIDIEDARAPTWGVSTSPRGYFSRGLVAEFGSCAG
jgi:hypothetical protein